MEPAGKLIAKLKLPAGCARSEQLVCSSWPRIVGKRIAAHSRAVCVAGNRLIVEVEDAVWQKQLTTLKSQILSRLGENFGAGAVSEIVFKIAIPRRAPQRAEQSRGIEDEADRITDPSLRLVYKRSRKRSTA